VLDAAVVCGHLLAFYAAAMYPGVQVDSKPWESLYTAVAYLRVAGFDHFRPQVVRVVTTHVLPAVSGAKPGTSWVGKLLRVLGLGVLTVLAAFGPSLPTFSDIGLQASRLLQPLAETATATLTAMPTALTASAEYKSPFVCKTDGSNCFKTYPDGYPAHPKIVYITLEADSGGSSEDTASFQTIVEAANAANPERIPEVHFLAEAEDEYVDHSFFAKHKLWEYDQIVLRYVTSAGAANEITRSATQYGIPVLTIRSRAQDKGSRGSYNSFQGELSGQGCFPEAVLPIYVCSLNIVAETLGRRVLIPPFYKEIYISPEKTEFCNQFDTETLLWALNANHIEAWHNHLVGKPESEDVVAAQKHKLVQKHGRFWKPSKCTDHKDNELEEEHPTAPSETQTEDLKAWKTRWYLEGYVEKRK
jgi:hypothetical protein